MYADTVNNLAVIHSKLNRLEDAETLHREALAIRRAVYGESSGVGQSLRNLAAVIRKQGRLREAEALQRQAVAVLRRSQGTEHPWTLFVELDLYDALLVEGQAEAVEGELRALLERWREDLAAEHRRYLAWGESTLAGALLAQGRLDPARAFLEANLPVLIAEYGSEHRLCHRARRWLEEVDRAPRKSFETS